MGRTEQNAPPDRRLHRSGAGCARLASGTVRGGGMEAGAASGRVRAGPLLPVHVMSMRIGEGYAARGSDRFEKANTQDSVSDRSEEHTSELQSLMRISYAVFCLKKKK